MTRTACPGCPFRASGGLRYDADAMERLEAGDEPACHEIVGHQAIFAELCPPPDRICVGYQEWLDESPDRAKPREL